MMKEQLEERLAQLRSEFEAGQVMLAEFDRRQVHLRSSILRIGGAIQVLEELLDPERSLGPVSRTFESWAGQPVAAQ
jgi:hypothetical protein